MIIVLTSKTGFTAAGHANYAQYGQDIVCSAVSVLTQTIALAMEKYCDSKITSKAGSLIPSLMVQTPTPNQETTILLTTLKIGLQQIQKQYPEHLQLQEE